MKKFALLATLLAGLVIAPAAFSAGGGPCHFHGHAPAKEAIVIGCANEQKLALISKGKIDPSWKAVKLDKAETVEGKTMKEWRLTYKNPDVKDAAKQTLYLFYTLTGNFIAANFDGK